MENTYEIAEVVEILKVITKNFEQGFNSSTLLGWQQNYDEQGRELRADPNYKSGHAVLFSKNFFFVRKEWTVRIWDRPARYLDFMNHAEDFIAEVDLTPDYLK